MIEQLAKLQVICRHVTEALARSWTEINLDIFRYRLEIEVENGKQPMKKMDGNLMIEGALLQIDIGIDLV